MWLWREELTRCSSAGPCEPREHLGCGASSQSPVYRRTRDAPCPAQTPEETCSHPSDPICPSLHTPALPHSSQGWSGVALQVHKGAEDSGTNLGTQSCDTRGPWDVPTGDTAMPSLLRAGRAAGTAQRLEPNPSQVGGGGQGWLTEEMCGRGSRFQRAGMLGVGACELRGLGCGQSVPHLHLPHRASQGPRVGGTQNSIRCGGQVQVTWAATSPGEATPLEEQADPSETSLDLPATKPVVVKTVLVPGSLDPWKRRSWCEPPPTSPETLPEPAALLLPQHGQGLCCPPGGPGSPAGRDQLAALPKTCRRPQL